MCTLVPLGSGVVGVLADQRADPVAIWGQAWELDGLSTQERVRQNGAITTYPRRSVSVIAHEIIEKSAAHHAGACPLTGIQTRYREFSEPV